MPLVRRTRATLRSAEFGFLGVWVYTRVQTPRRCGEAWRAGLAVLYLGAVLPLRTNWLNVGIRFPYSFDRKSLARDKPQMRTRALRLLFDPGQTEAGCHASNHDSAQARKNC